MYFHVFLYVTVFEKMGHPAKKLEMPFWYRSIFFFCARNYDIYIIFLAYSIIVESVDSISKDERGFPLTQYITNWGISRAG